MPTYQQGMTVTDDAEYELRFNRCAKIFITVTCLTIIDMVFVITCGFVYLKEYFTVVKDTFDPQTNSYRITQPFVILYFWQSIGGLLILLWVVFFVAWLMWNMLC